MDETAKADDTLARLQSLVEAQRAELEAQSRKIAESEVTLRNLLRVMRAERELTYREVCAQVYRQVSPLLDVLESREPAVDAKLTANIAALRRLAPEGPGGAALDSRLTVLTPTETRVCKLVQRGLSNKAIAELLAITSETVKTHRRSIRRKLGLNGQKKHLHKQLTELNLPT